MQIPALAIRNAPFTSVLALLLIGLGIISFLTMPRSEDPQIEFPIIVASLVYPGTNPVDMERLVVDPVEEVINELEDLRIIDTEISDGLAIIRVEFLYGVDADEKHDDVTAAIESVRPQLPEGIAEIEIIQVKPSDVPILQLALTSATADTPDFKQAAEQLETRLERVSQVKRVDIRGLPELEVLVRANWSSLRQRGISLDEFAAAVNRAAANIPAGYVNANERRFTVRSSGDYRDLDTLRRTVVRSEGDELVFVSDLATVSLEDALPTYTAQFQGLPAVFLTVQQREDTNIFSVMTEIDTILEHTRRDLPGDMALEVVFQQSDSVSERVNGFFANLWQGLLLVGLVVILVLGRRASLVVILAIPFSILIAIGWLDLSGFGIEQMSIIGLVIALGLLVDNAIVVTENTARHINKGLPPAEAAATGTSRVGWAIVSGTLTTVLAFVPLLMLQNPSGTFIRSMPVTVVLTLLASLAIALTLTPILAARLLRREDRPSPVYGALLTFARDRYAPLLRSCLRRPILVLAVALTLFGSSLSLVPTIGMSLFPKAEKALLLVDVEAVEGSTFQQMAQAAAAVASALQQDERVVSVASNLGRANPRVYYNLRDTRREVTYAQLIVTLKPSPYPEIEQWITHQRSRWQHFTPASVRFKELLQGPPLISPVTLRIIGDDLEQLRNTARAVRVLVEETPGTVNTDAPSARHKIDLRIAVHRDKAALYGVDLTTFDQTVRAGLAGLEVGQFRDRSGEDYPIRVSTREYQEPQIEQFDHMAVVNRQGELVPLLQLAELKLESALPRFRHYNLERTALVTADVLPGYQAEAVTNAVIAQLEDFPWPPGIRYEVGGEQENRKESFGGLLKAILIAVAGIFAILVMQFRSFRQSAVIFAALPFALTGAILGLYLSGYTFSFTAGVGLASLVGIVVNNSIILVDYANQRRAQGMSPSDAMEEAGKIRFVPILLTTLTTIGGLLPLTLSGSSMWSPMGYAIIGGLLLSTLLTLFVVPALYRLVERQPYSRA